jgi:Fe-S-cluster containining protein
MALDFTQFFERYEELVSEVDAVFNKFETDFPEQVRCEKGCSDCCYALFDLSLVEALYVNHHFRERFAGLERNDIMERAADIDRQLFRLKRELWKASQAGKSTEEIFETVARTRMRCPMLGEGDLCVMYDKRPITCRLYGVPTAIEGKGHTCAKSGFKGGEKYPTVHVDMIHERLMDISRDIAEHLGSKYKAIHEMLVPLSMALVTDYNEDYLGVRKPGDDAKPEAAAPAPQPQAPGASIPKMEDAPSEACNTCDSDKSLCASCKENSFSIVLGGDDE